MYLAINLLEPPLLALLAALLCRGAWGAVYTFGDNPNLTIYFFISVIVALFMGLERERRGDQPGPQGSWSVNAF